MTMEFEFFKDAKPFSANKSAKIDWSVFDHVWCINYAPYSNRRVAVEKEFSRIGLLGSKNFSWHFTTSSIFDNILYDVTVKQLKKNFCPTVGVMNSAFAHFQCLKTSLELGYDRVLVIEDDVRFLKSVGDIAEVINNLPADYEIVNFDVLAGAYAEGEWDALMQSERTNGLFVRYLKGTGASCYCVSSRAMRVLVDAVQKFIAPFDDYFPKMLIPMGMKCYVPTTQVCCQMNYDKNANSVIYGKNSIHNSYKKKNLDYALYNIPEKTGYTYGDFLE